MMPLWILLALTSGLLILAGSLQIYPFGRLILLLLLPVLCSLWLVPLPGLWPVIVGLDAVVAIAAAIDVFSLPRRSFLTAERQAGVIVSLGKPHRVTLTISNVSPNWLRVWIRDAVPASMTATPEEFFLELSPRSRATVSYVLRAGSRGAFALHHVYFRARSRFGCWQRMLSCDCDLRLNIYPDMKQLEEYALLARTNRLSLMGFRRSRKLGQDNEFERLRDYTRDDNYRHIEWRATARRRKLTVKDFQANQSQRVVFLIDCGRMMTSESAGVSLLDHALNAMLMLSFVALRAGDQVGLLCFSDRIHNYVPPRSGRGQTNRLLHAVFDRYAEMVESRFDEAFLHLATKLRKRALVVLVTNVIDEVNARQISRHLATLAGRHLPLGVLLRDHTLFDAIERYQREVADVLSAGDDRVEGGYPGALAPDESAPANRTRTDDEQLFTAAAAAEILTWRHRVLADLETSGVLSLDVFPEELAAPLVNRYLEIKARHLL